MVESQYPARSGLGWRSCSLPKDVSGNVSMTCLLYRIGQPVRSTAAVAMCGRQRCRLCGEDTSVIRGLGLGAGIDEQELDCVGNLGHGAAWDQRGWTSPVVGDASRRSGGSGRSNCHSVEMVDDEGVSREHEVGPVADLPTGTVVGAGGYAVGNIGGELFAVSRRCRHLGADLADGTLDEDGHLVCPWHQSAYDVHTGRMVRGPQGAFAKVPGLDAAYRALTRVLPLRRGQILERNGRLFVR